jgi:hypothetical protein
MTFWRDLTVKFLNQKLLIIGHINRKEMVFSVKEYSGQLKTSNVTVESIKESDTKELYVIDVG